jgi:high-affinity nickel-transport protein
MIAIIPQCCHGVGQRHIIAPTRSKARVAATLPTGSAAEYALALMFPLLAATGLGVGLLISSLLLGLRHGVDWDHIAAITDIAATQETPRRGFFLGLVYALGHGLVVLLIGMVVIVAGRNLPDSIDSLFGRIVGWTLILLGLYLLYSLIVHREGFRMQSRWMLIIGGVRRLAARFRASESVEHEHEHAAFDVHHSGGDAHDHDGDVPTHSHRHTHGPDATFGEYGNSVSFGVGMLHGVGGETPTQVVIFLAASQAGGMAAGLTVLVVFLVGLFIANGIISWLFSYGFQATGRRQTVQLALGAVTAIASLVVGALFALGQDAVLPAFFA